VTDVDPTITWGGKRWTLVGSAVMLITIVAAIAWVALSSHTPTQTVTSTQRRQITVAQHRPCPLASIESTAIPSATAPATRWINVRGFEFPMTADGPLYRDGGWWTCFAHTPMGGLLTATSSSVAAELGDQSAYASYFPPHHWSKSQLQSQAPAGGQMSQSGNQIVGYDFGVWSVDAGTVSVVESCASSGCQSPYMELTVQLQWQGRRWYIVGDSFEPGTGTWLTSLIGITPWGAP